METGKIASKTPFKVDLKAGEMVAWCRCGLSDSQPRCDGSHKTTDLKPLIFKAEEDKTVWLCGCKQTNTPPYCDGTHKKL